MAAAATLVLAALFILPAVYPPRQPLGYVAGTILSYAVRVTTYGGARSSFEVRLDRGETSTVAAAGPARVPGVRVCSRAVQRGHLGLGHLPGDRCAGP
ncbi:hypothetical protein [Tabrizicola aquatica]|uniref:hypothetical protein n=1 Tax=Tabrizicola aquatica TaxID=909926 RepID=UPI0011AED644|nr:hypothetical protein [Tabrizicola aquatica]